MNDAHHSTGLVLLDDQLIIRYRDRSEKYRCRVTFDLTRKHPVLIDCLESLHNLHPQLNFLFGGTEPFFVEPWPGATPIKCLNHGGMTQQFNENGTTLFLTLMPTGAGQWLDQGHPLTRFNAGVVNFNHYWINGPLHSGFCLQDDDWVFEFTPVHEDIFLYPANIQDKSYSFTHHLDVRRSSGVTITPQEANSALYMLSTFLAFCAERWVGITLVEGISEKGIVTMQNWGSPLVDAKSTTGNWLDEHHGKAMLQVFPKFAKLMHDSLWRDTVRAAIYWYVRADTQHVGSDGAIVLMQAALERLAWHVLVQTQRAISPDGFSKLPASDQLRLLLNTSQIPIGLPNDFVELKADAAQYNWQDGPGAFVAIRNQIVHPRKRFKLSGALSYYQALQLAKWYVELVLLRSCEFNGEYARRLKIPRWAGDVERVPWAARIP